MQLLDNSYIFYQSYHQNYINRMLHVFSIPFIALSLSVLLSKIYIFNIFGFPCKMNFLLINFYWIMYSCMNQMYFYPMGIYLYFIWFLSEIFVRKVKRYYLYASIIHILSWILQFSGHYLFEGNKPALIDSLHQSFLMAPLFSYLEFNELFYI